MSYDAGTSVGKYVLQADAALKTQQALIQNYQALGKAAQIKPPQVSGGASAAAQNQLTAAIERRAGIEARLAQVQNTGKNALVGLTQAENIYSAALQKVAKDSDAALRIQTQLQAVQNRIANISGGGLPVLPRTLESFGTQAIDQFKNSILGLVGPAALVTTAISAIPKAFELAQSSAAIDATRVSFDNLARSVGTTSGVLLNELRTAAQGTVSDAQLIQSANSGILLTGGKLASDLPQLLQIARASAQATGDDVGFVFDSLVKGIARGSPQIIDNAKITLDAEGAFRTYAASIGKSTDQLTRAEQQQATLNAVMAAGSDIIAKTGGAVETNATRFARAGTSLENFKNFVGTGLSNFLAPTLDSFTVFANTSISAANGIGEFLSNIKNIGADVPGAAEALAAYDAELERSGNVTRAEIVYQKVLADARKQAADAATFAARAQGAATDAATQAAQFYARSAALLPQVAVAQLGYANALEQTGIQQRAAALAADQKSISDKVASIDAQTHAIAQQKLAEQAQAAAQSLIAAGPAGARTAAILASSSSDIDILTAAYYRLAVAQGSAAKGATQQQAADFRSLELFGQTAAQTNAAIQKQIAADNARSQGILQNGTDIQKITELQRLYNDAVRQSGKDSAQAITARNALTAAQQAAAKPKRGVKDSNAVGLGVLDQDAIQKGETLQQQLDTVNKLLERTNLTEHQRNDLIEKRRKLEEEITAEGDKQRRAAIDARLGAVQDAQKRLKEAREAAGLNRAIAGGRLSSDQRTAAQLRLDEIGLEQQKRALDIQKDAKAAGVAVQGSTAQGAASAPTPQVPIPNVSTLPPQQPSAGVVVNLSLTIDGSTGQITRSNVDPNTLLNLIGGAVNFRNLSGGTAG